VQYDIWERPHYAYGIYQAAFLAEKLGIKSISVVEFGVAGGNGLVAMERIAVKIGAHYGLNIDVYGFDSGTGMPEPLDYRDLPYVWQKGFYQKDQSKLQARLQNARLMLGDVAVTTCDFLQQLREACGGPIGFVAFDLDYYSSTKAAFQIFDGSTATRLPRVYCYFDDIIWPEHACHNDCIGELCAIREFNEQMARRKIAPIHGLQWMRAHRARWNEQMYVHHDFDHPLYRNLITPLGVHYRQLALRH
jgi:hypothetical protein